MPLPKSLATPSNPSASGITYHSTTTITAPAPKVWHALLDFPSYNAWNSFTQRVTVPSTAATSQPLQVGDVAELEVHTASPTAPARMVRVQVSSIEAPTDVQEGPGPWPVVGARYRLCWKSLGFPTWALRTERVQEVEVLERGVDEAERCELRHWETMAGPLAIVVKLVVGTDLDAAFVRFTGDLKGWVEGRMGEGSGGGVEVGLS